jgi:hypothetical protein
MWRGGGADRHHDGTYGDQPSWCRAAAQPDPVDGGMAAHLRCMSHTAPKSALQKRKGQPKSR